MYCDESFTKTEMNDQWNIFLKLMPLVFNIFIPASFLLVKGPLKLIYVVFFKCTSQRKIKKFEKANVIIASHSRHIFGILYLNGPSLSTFILPPPPFPPSLSYSIILWHTLIFSLSLTHLSYSLSLFLTHSLSLPLSLSHTLAPWFFLTLSISLSLSLSLSLSYALVLYFSHALSLSFTSIFLSLSVSVSLFLILLLSFSHSLSQSLSYSISLSLSYSISLFRIPSLTFSLSLSLLYILSLSLSLSLYLLLHLLPNLNAHLSSTTTRPSYFLSKPTSPSSLSST